MRASGLDFTILRPGIIYGEGDDMLSHLALMIRTAPIFPIVGNGSSAMRPVDARDVASAVLAALQHPGSGETCDIVGPERMDLRGIVQRVADALNLRLSIWNTPVTFMRIPVWIMETVMAQPLSTRAQLAMLEEGLDGDPAPARLELGVTTAPFTVERIRPLLETTNRTVPFRLRLPASRKSKPSVMALAGGRFWVLLVLMCAALTLVFRTGDPWMGMTIVMVPVLAALVFLPAVHNLLRPSVSHTVIGIAAGFTLYGITQIGLVILPVLWPGWEASARTLYAWRAGHSSLFIAVTLPLIILAEEIFWRGLVARYLVERCGAFLGILVAATIYSLAHWATLNPLLLLAALACGIFWSWVFVATEDLVAPTISHLVWDTLLLFLFPVV